MRESKIKDNKWKKDFEKDIYLKWKSEKKFSFDEKCKKPVYSIDTPPPYVNTPVHIGQATTYVLMDMFARFRRMIGFNVLFPLGLDRNGLPIEMAAEKKFKVHLKDIPRDDAVEKCRSILEESSLASVDSFLRLGISFNSWVLGDKLGDVYETDSSDYRSLTQDTFIDLWNAGLIYEDERVNNFCPGCQTTLADAEVEYVDLPGFFYDVVFRCKETGEDIIIGTTRPELISSLGMIIFNPEDERYKHLEGLTAVSPLYGKEVPIKSHPSAQIDKGTGIMMMCSYGDLTDIRFFREQNLIPVISIGVNGRMNENSVFLEGLTPKKAREKIVRLLEEKKFLLKKTPVTGHRTPVCERSKDPIEFISMKEFYLKQVDFKEKMKELAFKMNFFAPASRQILLDWINSVSIDWPISRRRFYATEIPVWYCVNCNAIIVPDKGKYYQPWKEDCPVTSCLKCGNSEFKGEERVFDTWFDSSISPLYILKYSRNNDFFVKNSPCSLRPQGKEIIRTWLYYTVLKDFLLTGECIFKDVWVNYHIVDEKGYKMSKSKGNVIDPKDILDRFGAEPFRLWSAIEGNLEKTDFRCSFERIEGAGKTLTKFWNVAKFISMFPVVKENSFEIDLCDLDKWIISEVDELVSFSRKCFEMYDFHNPVLRIKNFVWESFASHYIELVKNRAYNDSGSIFDEKESLAAHYTLHYVLRNLLELLAPVLPMISSKIYSELYEEDVHEKSFPVSKNVVFADFSSDELKELNGSIWKAKKDAGKSLRDEVGILSLDSKFKCIEKDLCSAHNVRKIVYGCFNIEL
jgi:valyl-tRNA synthetase